MTDGLMQTGGTSRRVTIRFSGLPNSGFIINKGQSCGKKKWKSASFCDMTFNITKQILQLNYTQAVKACVKSDTYTCCV